MLYKILYCLIVIILFSSCGNEYFTIPSTLPPTLPYRTVTIPPSQIPVLIRLLESDKAEIRISAARDLGTIGAGASEAIPSLMFNLSYAQTSDVRKEAAYALGSIGPKAKVGGPKLRQILRDVSPQVRSAAAEALGKIGDTSSVPELTNALYDSHVNVNIDAAIAIARLAHLDLPDLSSKSFDVGKHGVTLIVSAARNWWEKQGRNQIWNEALLYNIHF